MTDHPSTSDPPAATACGQCGCTLPADGVPGLCPRCELSLALEGLNDPDIPARGKLGGYEMIEEAGRGGMGSVWKARQPGLGRLVAIKILPGGEWAGESQRLRFQREAEAAARLRHPHLVAVHDCGEHEGTLWYSMDFIEGESLAERIQRAPLEPRVAAVLMEKVARAVAFAHGQGVWHRDLKPANILMDAADEPHVTDFGLAHTEATTGLTVSGHLAGSPHYLPPERARGGNGDAPASFGDIYALGATLYHALTGRPPFSGPNVSAILSKVIADPPARPSSLKPNIPRDLETICLKCLEKSPAQRYPAAGALADDLKRFLEGLPVHARPISIPGRLWRWAGRRPALAGLAAALTLALAGLIVMFAVSARRSRTEAERLQRTVRAAEKAERAAEMESGIASARSARLSDTFTRRSEGLQSITGAAALASDVRSDGVLRPLRDEAVALLALPVTDFHQRVAPHPVPHEEYWWVERTRQWTMMRGPSPRGWHLSKADGSRDTDIPVSDHSFSTTCSRDGRYVFTKPDNELTTEGTYWSAETSPATALRKAMGRVIDWSPDSTLALRAESQGYAIDELATGRVICRYHCQPSYLCGRFSNDGRQVALTGVAERPDIGFVYYCAVVMTDDGKEFWQRDAGHQIAALAWSDEDTLLATVDGLGKIQVLARDTGLAIRVMQDPGGASSEHAILNQPALEFTRDGFLLSIGIRHIVSLWDISSGRLMASQTASGWHSGARRSGHEFGPLRSRKMDDSWLRIRPGIWTPVTMPATGEEPLYHLTWSPDSRFLAAALTNGTRFWNTALRRLGAPIGAPIAGDACRNVEFFPERSDFIASYPDGFWTQTVSSESSISLAIPIHRRPLFRTLLARAGSTPLIAAAVEYASQTPNQSPSELCEVLLFTPDRSAVVRKLPLHAPATCIALSPDGTLLAVGVRDHQRSFAVFKTADFSIQRDWQPSGGVPHVIQFDPSGRTFLAAISNVHLFDTASGTDIGTYSTWAQGDGIFGSPTAAFDPTGRWLAVTEPPRRILLHRRAPVSASAPNGWEDYATLESPSGLGVTRLAFSPDGKQLAAATTRASFELWDLAALETELRKMGIW
jgi:WD40 repeat protein